MFKLNEEGEFTIKEYGIPYGPYKIVIEPKDAKWANEELFEIKWLVEIEFEIPKGMLQFFQVIDEQGSDESNDMNQGENEIPHFLKPLMPLVLNL